MVIGNDGIMNDYALHIHCNIDDGVEYDKSIAIYICICVCVCVCMCVCALFI